MTPKGSTCRALLWSLVVVLLGSLSTPALADDALVLPKGRARATLEDYIYFPVLDRYNAHGNPEPLAADFDNRRLDATIFPSLALISPTATIGIADVKFEYHYNILDFGLQYGLTDKLTIGFHLPYFWADNRVEASVNSGPGSGANVGLRTGTGPGPCASTSPILPLSCPNTRRFTTEDVQQLLGAGLPGISGFGFKRVESWSGEGLGDIEAGAKYQYFKDENWALAASGGVRFPTGREDDPDDLVDVPFGTGAYALLFRLHNDYTIHNIWSAYPPTVAPGPPELNQPGDLVLDGTFRYDWVLPDESVKRVSSSITNPITTNREKVERDLGDKFDFEFSGKLYLTSAWSVTAQYRYAFKLEDEIHGRRGFLYRTLEQDTDATEQIYILSLSYSTLPLYLEKKFPIPMGFSLSYRDRFAGSGAHSAQSPSQVLKSRYISVGLQILF